MPILDAVGLEKSLSTRTLLKNATFTIVRGEKVGLVGANGAGKSTLGKILAGLLEADKGEVRTRKGAKISYLQQDPALPSGTSALDVALSGLSEWQALHREYEELCTRIARAHEGTATGDASVEGALLARQAEVTARIELLGGWNREDEARRILTILGIGDPTQDVGTMSGGEKRRVALARLLIEKPDLAILDEPTNHLDADTIEWLEEYLGSEFPGAIILITHDRWLLNQVVDRTFEVEHGQIHSSVGGWEAFLQAREERREHEARTEANRQNFLRKEIEWLRRQPKARTGKQKARIQRAEDAIADAPRKTTGDLRLQMDESRLGSQILEARGLSVHIAGRCLVERLDFHLMKKMRVGIVGKSGAGKTTLLRTLVGELAPQTGEVIRGKNTEFAYLDQMRSGLDDEQTVYDAVTGGRPSVTFAGEDVSSYSYLARFRFEGETLRQRVGALSGGERSRLALARLLLSKANVIVLDEPTNDLDVMTLSALEEMLSALDGAALVVSHDRYFLDRIATSVLALDGNGSVEHLQGGYSAYAEFRDERSRARKLAETDAKVRAERASAPPEKKPKLTYAEEIELRGLMTKVEEGTKDVQRLEADLADPTLYTERHHEAPALEARLAAARAALEELELRWLTLEEKREASS